MHRTAMLSACAFGLLLLPTGNAAHGASLRAFRSLHTGNVHLSDLFDGVVSPDRVLGASPAPGARILVQAPQLAAIARDYAVDWRPMTGAEQTVLERESQPYARDALMDLLRPKLASAGAPPDAAITLPDYAPPLLPAGATPQAQIADLDYDAANYRFTATLTVSVPDQAPMTVKLSGRAVPVVEVAVLTHGMHGGGVLAPDDIRIVRVPASSLHGNAPLRPETVVGLAVRRDIPAGQALAIGDLTHPLLVERNATVRMVLSAGTIALAAQGTALEEGAMGAHIRVQNPSSRAIILAEVSGADEVRIMPGRTLASAATP